ncbi:hypothetical protein GCM10023238_31660 [Streptomyces heliomycini]
MELVDEHGYEATTLGDIADGRAPRGAWCRTTSGKRQLVQSAVHRLMHRTLEEAWSGSRAPRTAGSGWHGPSTRSWAWLGTGRVLMRQHMAGLLQAEGFLPCPSSGGLAELAGQTPSPGTAPTTSTRDYPMLRALLMAPCTRP